MKRLERHERSKTSALIAFAALATGCYQSHRLPVDAEEIRDVDDEVSFALCRPRSGAPLSLSEVTSTDGGELDVEWTGTTSSWSSTRTT